jgi:hypothetical protein
LFRDRGAFLNADLTDADGSVLKIRDNVITFNRENVFKIELFPESQSLPDCIVLRNQHEETAMILTRNGEVWDLNCLPTGTWVSKNGGNPQKVSTIPPALWIGAVTLFVFIVEFWLK